METNNDIDLYLSAAQELLPDGKDKEYIGKIRQTYQRLGAKGVQEELEFSPDAFGISGRAARDAVDVAMVKASAMFDFLVALYKQIDRNI